MEAAYVVGGGEWHNYTNGNEIRDLAVEGNYVWAATEGGAVRWNRTDGTYVKYTTADGLRSNTVRAVAVDGVGNKWFGTDSGLNKYDGSTWTTYTSADGVWTLDVNAIAVDGNGHVWVGTNRGVSKYDGSTWASFTTADGLAHNGAADNPPATAHEARPKGGLGGPSRTGSSACYAAKRSEAAITSGWPKRSGGIRRAVMAASEAAAITTFMLLLWVKMDIFGQARPTA